MVLQYGFRDGQIITNVGIAASQSGRMMAIVLQDGKHGERQDSDQLG